MSDDLEIEPDEAVEVLPPDADGPAIARVLPQDFPLTRLLQFVPDVRLKHAVTTLVVQARALDVTTELPVADALRERLRQALANIDDAFDFACSAANTLHKRLTGLRSDFQLDGAKALADLNKRIYDELQRRREVAENERRARQAKADAEARERAREAASLLPPTTPAEQRALYEQQAARTTAPPVSMPMPTLTHSAPVEKWKARPAGTPEAADPNPSMDSMTDSQLEQIKQLVTAIANGEWHLLSFLEVNWSYANRRANDERRIFDVPGLEAFDAGSLRKRGTR